MKLTELRKIFAQKYYTLFRDYKIICVLLERDDYLGVIQEINEMPHLDSEGRIAPPPTPEQLRVGFYDYKITDPMGQHISLAWDVNVKPGKVCFMLTGKDEK